MNGLARRGGHALLGELAGWRVGFLDRVTVAEDGTLGLRPLPSGRPLADAEGSFGGLAVPTGLAVYGDHRYRLDPATCTLERSDPCRQGFEVLDCFGGAGEAPRRLRDPHGIAISPRGDLYVADTGNRRVQVLALKGLVLRGSWGPLRLAGGCPEPVPAGAEGAWRPWDVEVTHGRVLVSDPENDTVHVFDCRGRWLAAWLEASPGVRLQRPTHLAVDRTGRVYVMQDGRDEVAVLGRDGRPEGTVRRPEELEGRFDPLPAGVAPDRPRAAFEPEGRLYAGPLDSRLYRCQWHRVQLGASLPEGTTVRVSTVTSEAERTAEEILELPEERWSAGPAAVATQPDGDWDCLLRSPPGRYLWLRLTLTGGAASPEVRRARVFFPRDSSLQFLPAVYAEDPESREFTGRFLSIFDTIRGSVADRLDGVAADLDPAATPARPLRQGELDFLSWLGAWLGVASSSRLPETRRRALVASAHLLYRLRGTPEGLRRQVELTCGVRPLVLEHFKLRRWLLLAGARLGSTSTLWGDAILDRLQLGEHSRVGDFQLLDTGDPLHDPFHHLAHKFTVFVPRPPTGRTVDAALVEQAVAAAKPAHTEAKVALVAARFRVGVQSLVGLDTVVGRYPDAVREGQARLGVDAVLGPSDDERDPPTMRVGVRARIGSTTRID